jgi:hypothetical protein
MSFPTLWRLIIGRSRSTKWGTGFAVRPTITELQCIVVSRVVYAFAVT